MRPWFKIRESTLQNGTYTAAKATSTSEYQCTRVAVPWVDFNAISQYGYVPFAVLDTHSTGRMTREGSRTLEVFTQSQDDHIAMTQLHP